MVVLGRLLRKTVSGRGAASIPSTARTVVGSRRSFLTLSTVRGGPVNSDTIRGTTGPVGSTFHPLSYASSSYTTKTVFDLPDPSDHVASSTFPAPHASSLALTKIVATIGPTSEQAEPLAKVVKQGMKIMRLNFSHATKEEVELRCENLIKADPHKVHAVLLDTKGPEIRTGKLLHDESGHETVQLVAGENITLHTTMDTMPEAGSTATDLFIDYKSLATAVAVNNKVLLDDGAIILTVVECDTGKGTVHCQILNTGDLRSRAGVNLPLADTSDLPAMSEKDKADILYGMSMDVDFVAASFVQSAQGVREIRAHMQDCAKQLKWNESQPLPLIVSKIETAGALQHFDEILAESDAIMVARGDLGVEIPLQQVTNAQKEMVAACNAVGKPVVVATQMLESMTKNPRATRAEVADVTNAVYDGADAVMLSGETAKGKYPDGTVKFMNEIVLSAERYARSAALGHPEKHAFLASPKSPDSAIARAAVTASKERSCTAILVLTHQGSMPRLVASFRPDIPIFTFCPNAKIARQLQLYRGIHPLVGLDDWAAPSVKIQHAVQDAKRMGLVAAGDEVVIVSMDDEELGRTATMKIATVPDE